MAGFGLFDGSVFQNPRITLHVLYPHLRKEQEPKVIGNAQL